MNNTIQIKRRLVGGGSAGAPLSLSGGELAFNEVDKVLYYGCGGGTFNGDGNPGSVIGIGGAGLYVDRTTNQTVSGVKTFQSTISALGDVEVDGNVDANSFSINGTEIVNSSRNATFVDISAEGNVIVTGNLTVQGDTTTLNTETYQTSAFNITNEGSTTALVVNQTGITDIAEFQDGGTTALIIKGSTATPGYVGIGTAAPNEKLTVSGNISASGIIYGGTGLEIGSGVTTLFVENGKVGINTETPNEALTIVGNISASQDIYAVTGVFTGDLYADGAAYLASILDVTGAATFASSVSAAGAVDFDLTLDVVGATTLQSTLDVTSGATFASTLSVVGVVDFDSSLDVVGATTLQSTLDVTSGATFSSTVSAVGAMTLDNTLYVAQNSTFFANVSGQAGVSTLIDFIIDGGMF